MTSDLLGPDGRVHDDCGDGMTACGIEADQCEEPDGALRDPCQRCFPDLDEFAR